MKEFKELSKLPVNEVEENISKVWSEMNIYEKTLNTGKDNFVFYDGPATANGYPGLHHMVAKFLKDTFCKYQTMEGKSVIRKIGWDTHGLPVELQVEKELGFKSKNDIEKYGIGKFNDACRENVMKNKESFSNLTTKMGQFVDLDNPYITYDNKYIETEWWILKKFFDEGLFYEGHKIVPFCPRCGTALASHEVAQGYKEVSVDSVTVPFKMKDEDAYFLVWTTTPWTLISNVGICVNPKEEYVKVLSKGNKFILAKKLLDKVIGEEYELLETYKGMDLEKIEYEQLLPFIKVNKKAFFVTCDEYVTMEDGTGIVHIAPAFGEDDKLVAQKYDLPVINPVGDDGRYTEGPWEGTLVFEADLDVIKYLKENDKLFKKQKINHNYPHCWRCSTPLIYYAKPSYYLKITDFKDKIIENNKKINWYPSYVGEKRFGNWLENLNDWAISRNRYWGTPLPYWRCECGHDHMIGSVEELRSMSTNELPEVVDLHRPVVDDIKLKCPKCSKEMSRCEEVIDCWFDSGSMPFAQYHYPFENEELFNSQFPADFICEGIDQTRGWFYTLLVISTFVKGVSPFKNVLVNDLLLDASGKKMSKSKGNIVEPFTTMKEYGADTVRFYLPYASPVWMPLKFDVTGLKEVYSKFFNPLKNTYNFFSLYATMDKIDIDACYVKVEDREEIDKWVISRYNTLVKTVNEAFEEYDLNKVVKSLADFVSEDLSNWYIRRNRNRFWKSELDNSKKSVYITTYEVLCGLSKLIAPVTPFIAEELYTNLIGDKSVHQATYPKCDKNLINEPLEEKMDLVRDLISIGRKVREENKIKVRQPISSAMIDGKNEEKLGSIVDLIKEELNVKEVLFVSDLSLYMNKEIVPNFKEVGRIFGKNVNNFKTYLQNLTDEEKENITNLEFEGIKIEESMYEIRVSEKEGLSVGTINNNFIILNLNLNEELINEGIAREFISKIQNLRKEEDFVVSDRIKISYNSESNIVEAINKYDEYIKNETLATEINIEEKVDMDSKLNDYNIGIKIQKN
ncbi:MAG: isoleucine--tRNA ligase [bacterium]